jgi:copper chaperone NosL
MAISQASYAGQFIDREGNVFKFDDIGCMIRFARENNRSEQVTKFFVMDYDTKKWLEANGATYVKSDGTASPMASGLTAFQDISRATGHAAKSKGRVLHFEDLWKGDVAEPSRVTSRQR